MLRKEHWVTAGVTHGDTEYCTHVTYVLHDEELVFGDEDIRDRIAEHFTAMHPEVLCFSIGTTQLKRGVRYVRTE
jgi:hypothetical protein